MADRKSPDRIKMNKKKKQKAPQIVWTRFLIVAAAFAIAFAGTGSVIAFAARKLSFSDEKSTAAASAQNDSSDIDQTDTEGNGEEPESESQTQSVKKETSLLDLYASKKAAGTLRSFEEAIDQSALESIDASAVSFGFVPQNRDENNRPVDLANFDAVYNPYGGVVSADTDEKVLYLTMDEGYENGFTPEILDVLKEKGVKGTFFITGQFFEDNPELVERMIAEGHTVGNHTVNHPDMPLQSLQQQYEEIKTLHNAVLNAYGYEMKYMRYPMGRASEQSAALMEQAGYTPVFWSFAYADYDTDNQPDQTSSLAYMLESLHPGAVYLLHAVSETNTKVLGDFIDGARAQGYTFGSIEEV
jgi:delta-lactam-biosynthetic de-N-acetylase